MAEKSIETYFKEQFDIDIKDYPQNVQQGLIDIEKNHNRSWTLDVYCKNKNNMEKRAIFYRGTTVTYQELFDTVEQYAAAFVGMGIKENMEVPMCMANCPEFVYVILALNLLNARMNCFGPFDMDYLTEIINECDSSFMICTDDQYPKISKAIDDSNVEKVIMFSLADSLPGGKDPYINLDRKYYNFKNHVSEFKKKDSRIIGRDEFLNFVGTKVRKIEEYSVGDINSEFLITYSSGSTNSNRPKAIVHSNRSMITMGRFQDRDLSDLPSTKDLVGEALIPTHSNTDVITSISDVLYKACAVALEPIYNRDFFLDSLSINQPNYVSAPRNMVVHAMKKLYGKPKYKDFTMPYMMLLTSVGEPTSIGEEKFINKMLKKAKCGVDKLPPVFAPVPVSIGGGNCECGGLFFTPYRKYQDLLPKYLFAGKRVELRKYHMVQVAILDEQGKKLIPEQVGRLVVKTPTVMKRYKNNVEATNDFFVKDTDGRRWADCKVYATMDKYGSIKMLGRMGNELILSGGKKIPLFCIGNVVERDYKNIMSYEVVNIDNTAVIHIEFQPGVEVDSKKCLMKLEEEIIKEFGEEVSEKICYRVRTFEDGFVGTGCEKRNYNALVAEGITKLCVKPVREGREIRALRYQDYKTR